jgi:hypothetical protein
MKKSKSKKGAIDKRSESPHIISSENPESTIPDNPDKIKNDSLIIDSKRLSHAQKKNPDDHYTDEYEDYDDHEELSEK